MEAKKFFKNSNFFLDLKNVSLKEVSLLNHAPCNIFLINEFTCELIYQEGAPIANEQLRVLNEKNKKQLLIHQDQLDNFRLSMKDQLIIASRGLSMGDPLENAKKLISPLSLMLKYLYQDPTNDVLLTSQIQTIKILVKYLLENPKHHKQIFEEILSQNIHYVYAQPLLSSVFLVGYLKNIKSFNDKEIEILFLTSYFKDIGMSLIPTSKWDQSELSEIDRAAIQKHPQYSCQILQGRLPISPAHFKIIEHHHVYGILSPFQEELEEAEDNDYQLKMRESTLVNIMDILAAMITKRPYREAVGLFDALEFIRVLIGDSFPKEFKTMVNYFHQFFSK